MSKNEQPELDVSRSRINRDKFDVSAWISNHSPLISFLGVLLALLGFLWIIHSEIAVLNSRVGVVEGKIEVLMDK